MADATTEAAAAFGNEAEARLSRSLIVPPELWPDPHPHYHQMRAETPIRALPEWDEFLLTRYADCERVLRDPTFSSSPEHRRVQPDIPAMMEDFGRPTTMLMMDPPDHTRLRKL